MLPSCLDPQTPKYKKAKPQRLRLMTLCSQSSKRTWFIFKHHLYLSQVSCLTRPRARTHTHTHSPICAQPYHQSTTLLSSLFDPQWRVLSVVPPSEFQRFWDNSNVSWHILGPPWETAAATENATALSLPPLSLLFNQSLSAAPTTTVVCCLSLGKCRPKWLLCAEEPTAEIQRGDAGALRASRRPHGGGWDTMHVFIFTF